jgi:hypothetical protein
VPQPPSGLSYLVFALVIGGVTTALGVALTDIDWTWWAGGGAAGGALLGWIALHASHMAAVRERDRGPLWPGPGDLERELAPGPGRATPGAPERSGRDDDA